MRKSPRVSVDVPVSLDTYGQTSSGRTTNLGLQGAFISLDYPPPVNAVVNLRFNVPFLSRGVEILARVARCEPHGIGAEFLDLDVHSRSLLYDFLIPLWPKTLSTLQMLT